MTKICHIIGAGDTCPKDIEQLKNAPASDYIIAADGGYHILQQNNIIPNLIVGDFDSYDEEHNPLPADIPVIRLQPEKDYTDIHTAINHGLEAGFTSFYLYGATGGRIDHTIANIQLMAWLAGEGCLVRMFGPQNIFDTIVNSAIHFPADRTGYLSVFSLSDTSTGVCESGLKYTLSDATLNNTFPLGVSNEFIGEESCIRVQNGCLLIISTR